MTTNGQLGRRLARLGAALLSAPLLAAAQSPVSFGPLALVALVPWLWATRHAGRGEALALGALVGTAYGCLVAAWLPEALRHLGSSPYAAALGLLLTAAWAKLPLFTLVGGIAHTLRARSPWAQILGVSLAFGTLDWGIGRWSLGVPWALLGDSQRATLGVAQLAVVGGVPLLSAGVAALNQAIALAIEGVPSARSMALALAGGWAAAALLGLPLAQAMRPAPKAGQEIPLLVVQPDLPRPDRWAPDLQALNLERTASYTGAALAEDGDGVRAIVWPENLLTSPVDQEPELAHALHHRAARWRIPIISGLVRSPRIPAPRRYRSSVLWIDPTEGVIAAIDKVRAIPLLESGRALFTGAQLASLYGRAARWPKVEEAPDAGPLRGAFTVTPVLCYEVLFPGLVARRRAPDSVVILNLADDSWVAGETASRQLTDFALLRAVEQRLPLVRVAHGGLSVHVDAFGREIERLPLDQYAHMRVTLVPAAPPTLGEKLALLSLPLATGLGVWWALAGGRRVRERRRLPGRS